MLNEIKFRFSIRADKLFVKFSILAVFSLILLSVQDSSAIPVKGIILQSSGNLTVVKVWGTHYERGFAQGYLLAGKIDTMVNLYLKPMFGFAYNYARSIVQDTMNFNIDPKYIQEAMGVANGADSGGAANVDYVDILVGNSFLDIAAILTSEYKININMGCSSLIDWGDATANTSLNGKSVISRHLDWTTNTYLTNSQVMVVHIPVENSEQPWLLIGFAAQIAPLSATNRSGVSAFMHVLQSPVIGNPALGMRYIPVLFTIRKGLENFDLNNDGHNNTNDVRAALVSSVNGIAFSSIITICAKSTEVYDSLVALVGEVTSTPPLFTFRSNSYSDSIPGDNLYAANNAIARNNVRLYCTRYLNIVNHIGNGLNIDSLTNWNLMKDWSSLSNNYQFIQVIPELKRLKLSVRTASGPAYQNPPIYFNLDNLFDTLLLGVQKNSNPIPEQYMLSQNYPNPFNPITRIKFSLPNPSQGGAMFVRLVVYDVLGKEVAVLFPPLGGGQEGLKPGSFEVDWDGSGFASGVYFYKLTAGDYVAVKKMVLLK